MDHPKKYHDLVWTLNGAASCLTHIKRTDLATVLYDLLFMISYNDSFSIISPPIYKKAASLHEKIAFSGDKVDSIRMEKIENMVWDLNSAMLSDKSIVHNVEYDRRISLRNTLPAEKQKFMGPRQVRPEDRFIPIIPEEYEQSILDALVGTNYTPQLLDLFKAGLPYGEEMARIKLHAARRQIMLGQYEDGVMLIYSTTPSYWDGLHQGRYA